MMMNSAHIKELIRFQAKQIGFEDIGFAKSDILTHEFDNYEKWIKNHYNADMAWMERNVDKRKDPSQVLENTKTILITAFNYFSKYKHEFNSKKGKISRYAWNYDYHDIVKEKLDLLINFLKNRFPSSRFKSYVDTGPILEKIWAEKAGIGWQGKNSLIISKKIGSYFFIGTILTDFEFTADEQISDNCYSCRKCIEACPTDAIIEDKIIDSNKCISYWTIEAKPEKEIPEEISKKQENWLYGCDICQEVCPWNKNLPPITTELKLHPRLNQTSLEIDSIISMQHLDFSARFKKSPIKRTKLDGLKRNAISIERQNDNK